MRKAIILLQLPVIWALAYMTIKNGMTVLYGIALLASNLSLLLNILCEVKYGKEDTTPR